MARSSESLVGHRERRALRLGLLAALLAAQACSPLACWFPPELPTDPPLELTSDDGDYPLEPVDVVVDDEGVPHIFAASPTDVAYAIGFMHAKDRLFQMWGFRAALFGRLAEVLGDDALEDDRAARLITYRIDEQLAAADALDVDMLESYSAGVNAGAAYAGPSAEMVALGIVWEPWTPRDSLAISRYFGWALASGWEEELARVRIAARIPYNDPRYDELFPTGTALGRPVVRTEEHSGEVGYPYPWLDDVDPELDPKQPRPWVPERDKDHPPAMRRSRLERHPLLGLEPRTWKGASNAWAVSGEHTTTGRAVLSHDPHLAHMNPGLFYLAHFEGPDFTIAGATPPGLPAVVLGHGRHVAWGTPYCPVDVMDTVRITPNNAGDAYRLDNAFVPFERLEQTFQVGQGPNAPTWTDTWLITEFGPVLPEVWQDLHDEGEMYALMWTGHDPIEGSGAMLTGIWDVGRAENVEQATAAVQKVTSPSINWAFAFDDGTIAYRVGGDVPIRRSAEPTSWPRDGTRSSAGWAGRLPAAYKPQLDNPASGYIVVANQQVVDETGPAWEVFQFMGARPWRALRIDERLSALIEAGPVEPADIFDLQQDVESTYARAVAPIYGEACPIIVPGYSDEVVLAACRRVAAFDGQFTIDSEGALVFEEIDKATRHFILALHLGDEVAGQVDWLTQQNLYRALLDWSDGLQPAILDDLTTTDRYEGLEGVMQRSMIEAMGNIVARAGDNPDDWRWGAHHYRRLQSELTAIPLVGALMQSQAFEESGCRHCVRAEGERNDGSMFSGAVLRIHADMSSPPVVGVVNDVGQSGHFGHPMYDVAYERWSTNDPAQLAVSRDDAEARASGRLRLLPAN
jgi:penicillin amidase